MANSQLYPCKRLCPILIAVVCAILPCMSAKAAGLDYTIMIVDTYNRLGSDRPAVESNLRAALDEWGRYIYGLAPLDVEVQVVGRTASGRFSGRSECAVDVDYNGQRVLEEGAPHKLRTGNDPNGAKPDVIIEVEAEFMRRSYWIDPEPRARTTPVPPGKIDLVTVFAHELGHGLGINGRRNLVTGQVPARVPLPL